MYMCNGSIVWLDSSVVECLHSKRKPGFESRSGHVLFPPLCGDDDDDDDDDILNDDDDDDTLTF